MIKTKITIDGQSRWLNALSYEYFLPVYPDKSFYRAFLQKNFPYEFCDSYSPISFTHKKVPRIIPTRTDIKIADDCRRMVESPFQSLAVNETLNYGFGHQNTPSVKDQYYETLSKERCKIFLDRGLNPNEPGLYDMLLRPSELNDTRIKSSLAGGLFSIEFDSTENDELFMDWLILGTKKEGQFEIYKGDDPHFMKIEFWDCYCVGLRESMQQGDRPMQMALRLSPAITRNRSVVKHEKSWKTSDIQKEWKPVATSAPIEQEEKKVLVEKVEGEAEAMPGQTIIYNITQYSEIPSAEDKKNVKWELKIDGNSKPIKETGESVKITIEKEWAGKTITVMPYLNSPTESVSTKTKVVKWKLPKYFAKSAKEPGYDEDGAVAEDMTFLTTTNEKLIDYNKLFRVQANSSDEALFADMYILARGVSLKGGWGNCKALIDHFRSSSGTPFSSDYLNNALANHPTLQEFLYEEEGVIHFLKEQLKIHNGNINNIELLKGEILSTRVKFSTGADKLNGLTFSVNDTHSYKIHIVDYDLKSNNTFDAKLRIEIYDHFGLDFPDIEKFVLGAGFRAWYVLQHVRGYKPFITKMTCIHTITNQSF